MLVKLLHRFFKILASVVLILIYILFFTGTIFWTLQYDHPILLFVALTLYISIALTVVYIFIQGDFD